MSGKLVQLESGNDASKTPGNVVPKLRDVPPLSEGIIDDAVNETGFGRFNLKIMAVSSVIFMNVAFSITSIALILPAAACDFKMTTVDKGRLTAAPMLGMIVGSYFWGCYAAIKGRRRSLLVTLFLHGISEFLASLIRSYWLFLFLKFVNGAAMNGQTAVIFMYLGEFQPTKYRNKMLSWMEMAWVIGMLVLACVGWLIIPLAINFDILGLNFRSWNLFVMVCSLPALISGVWLLFLPETPKYLAETCQYVKMLKVLQIMYAENTNESPKEYIVRVKNSGNTSLVNVINRLSDENAKEELKRKSLRIMIRQILANTIEIMRAPFITRTFAMCLIFSFVASSYYMLTLWLPEVFHRYADFEELYPNVSASVCTLSRNNNLTGAVEISDYSFGCHTPIQDDVFLDTFILGASCIPVAFVLPIFVNCLGYKYLLVMMTSISAVSTICLFWVGTSFQNLIVSCIFESSVSASANIVYCLLVDLYPTNLRAMAAGLTGFISRVGTLIGNLLVGYLIDDYCVLLIIIVAAQLFGSAILALLLPGKKKVEVADAIKSNEVTMS